MSDYFQKIFANFDEELASRAVEEADEAAVRAVTEAENLRHILEAYTAWKLTQGGQTVGVDMTSATPAVRVAIPSVMKGNAKSPTGREAVKSVFLADTSASEREWTIPLIAEALGLDESYHKRIGITLLRLTTDGFVIRPRKGRYKLPTGAAGTAPVEEEADPEDAPQKGSGQGIGFSNDLFASSEPAPNKELGSFA